MELYQNSLRRTALCFMLLALTSANAWNASQTPQGHGPEVLIVSGAQNGPFPGASRDVLLGQLAAFSEFASTSTRDTTGPPVSLQLRFGGSLLESLHEAIDGGLSGAVARNRSVVAVLGPETSDPSVLAAALLNHYPGISHITQIATTELLADRQRFPSYFRMSSSTDTIARAMLLQLQRLGRTRFSYVVNNNAYGHSAKRSMDKVATELGMTPATRAVHSPGVDDFATVVEQIHSAAVRSIFLWLTADDIDAFVLAAQNAGMDLRNDYTAFLSLLSFESIPADTRSHLDGAFTTLQLVAQPTDPLVIHALSQLEQAKAQHPSLFPDDVADHSVGSFTYFMDAYASTHAVLSAINATAHAGRDPTNSLHVRGQLRNTTFASFAGRQLSFGTAQEVQTALEIVQRLPNGTLRVVGFQHTNGDYEARNEPYVSPLHTTPFVADSCKLNSVRNQLSGACELCPDGMYNPSGDGKSQCVPLLTSTTLDTQMLVATVLGAVALLAMAMFGGYAKHIRLKAESAEQRAKETSTYTSFVFHEVRNPLAQTAAHLEFIGTHVSDLTGIIHQCPSCTARSMEIARSLREDLNVAQLGMDHTVDVLNGIRDLSDLLSGSMSLMPEPTTLHALCSDLVVLLSQANAAVDVTLDCVGEIARLDRQCLVDARRLRQVLMNLLLNALKATTHGSVCLHVAGEHVDTEPAPTNVRGNTAKVAPFQGTGAYYAHSTESSDCMLVTFSVRDTGQGLNTSQLQTIFQPVLHNTVHRHTGLGLSISKKLVECMGGSLTAKSPWSAHHPGTEVSFTLRLSLASSRASSTRSMRVCSTSWDTGVVPDASGDDTQNDSPWTPQRALRPEPAQPAPHSLLPQRNAPLEDLVVQSNAQSLPPVVEMSSDSNDAQPSSHSHSASAASPSLSTRHSSSTSKVLLPNSIRVLLVDDLRINRAILARKFRSGPFSALEWKIDHAATGEEALRMFLGQNYDDDDERHEPSYDLIVLDQILTQAGGELLGTETCERMRAIEKAKQWPATLIVFCSGNAGPDDLDGFIAAGGEFCWGKPTPLPLTMYEDLLAVMRRRQDATRKRLRRWLSKTSGVRQSECIGEAC